VGMLSRQESHFQCNINLRALLRASRFRIFAKANTEPEASKLTVSQWQAVV